MSDERRNSVKRQHILPRLLLKRFAENGQVWVLDRVNRRSYQRSINDAAFQRGYYSVETTGEAPPDCIETGVLSEIETRAEPIIQDLLAGHHFPKGNDWAFMAAFLAFIYARCPTLRTMAKSAYELGVEAVNEYILSSQERWTSIMKGYAEKAGMSPSIRYDEALRARDKLKITVDIPNTHYVQNMLEFAVMLLPVFLEMTANLETLDVMSEAEYAISDCPILPVPRSAHHVGASWLKNADSDLFFPLSARACLVLNYDTLAKVTTVNRQRVAFVNHFAACNSERVVISRKRDFVWRRENGTTSTSREELLAFLEQFTGAPGEMRVDKDRLRTSLSAALKRSEDKAT